MNPAPIPKAPTKPEEMPKDKGFDASHGYGPAHGGPSGPGDTPAKPAKPEQVAPAPPPDEPAPPPDEDEEDDA